MWTLKFWKGAGERGIKTFLQTLAGTVTYAVGVDAIGLTARLGDIAWSDSVSIAVLATLWSFATSVGNADFTAGPDTEYIEIRPKDFMGPDA